MYYVRIDKMYILTVAGINISIDKIPNLLFLLFTIGYFLLCLNFL